MLNEVQASQRLRKRTIGSAIPSASTILADEL